MDDTNHYPCIYPTCNQIDINKYHAHEGAYTIDADLSANPSTVAVFGHNTKFFNLPDHVFEFIIFEGGGDANEIFKK